MKHTKGPWTVMPGKNRTYVDCTEINQTICTVHDLHESLKDEHGTADANAHLIAAAPEMLEALEGVRLFLMDEALPTKNGALNLINSAIKKARGE